MRHRPGAPTWRCANPTLMGGSDDEAIATTGADKSVDCAAAAAA